MTESTVDCPVCGESFDPAAAGGWCTNSDCGEWRYDDLDSADDAGSDAPGAGDETIPESEAPSEATATDEGESDEGESDEDETDEDETDEGEPADAEITCPACESSVDADANFCPVCGEDVSELEPGSPEELTACPACGADVDPEDNFCSACGEDLDAHRDGGTTAQTGDAQSTQPDESSSDAPDDREASETPESLLLYTRGEEIAVADGDTVGRKLRRIVTETGGDEDDAVRVHREHVRFVREDGRFYVVDLGRNPTRLNDTPMEQGDREPVEPGDELHLSGVVTLVVREP